MKIALSLLTALVASISTATAVAARPATNDELSAIAASIGDRAECIAAEVSTVDQSWGLAYSPNTNPSCTGADGFIIVHHGANGWRDVFEGSDPTCPIAGVPVAVTRDLKACTPPKTYLACSDRSGLKRKLRSRPTRCETWDINGGTSRSANLVGLRWRGWGDRVAKASGIERGAFRPLAHIHAVVRAYGRKTACGGFLYTRLSVRTRYGHVSIRLPRSCDF